MKKMNNPIFFTLLFTCFLWGATANAQKPSTPERTADKLTHDMGAALHLNEASFIQLKKFNRERLTRLTALSQKAHQLRAREVEVRVDQIEQEYQQHMFHLLNAKQYIQYRRFQETRPEFNRPSAALASAASR